jgi:hypothetical protein
VSTVTNHLDIGRFGRVFVVIAVAIAAAILVAACGGSHATHTRKAAEASSTIRFARCMRANGVPSYPDAGAEVELARDSRGQIVSVNGVAVSSPAFTTAQQHCEHYISSSASVSPAEQAKFRQENLKVARCMRAHGIKSFPDSGTFNQSSALNPQAPAFKAASKACGVGFATGASLP